MEMGRHRCTGAIPGTPPHIHRGHPLLRLTRRRREGVRGVGGGSGRGDVSLGGLAWASAIGPKLHSCPQRLHALAAHQRSSRSSGLARDM